MNLSPARQLILDPSTLDEQLSLLPNTEGVYRITAGETTLLGRTSTLRKRLLRMLRPHLRPVLGKAEYWTSGSSFESTLLRYSLARESFPLDYRKRLKLSPTSLIQISLADPYPRTHITTRISAASAVHYGPFQSRAAAELYETQVLELFQVRRCPERLEPRADHPGCMYGEMNMCLRPCQLVVGTEEYQTEVVRLIDFLDHNGSGLLQASTAARERLSEEMNFEAAAREHKRTERIQAVIAQREPLTRNLDQLCGIAVTPAAEPETVLLWFFASGWHDPVPFQVARAVSASESLDARLRGIVAGFVPSRSAGAELQDHVALLTRWFYSSWREGEWVGFESLDRVPYRKLVNAIGRVGKGAR